MSVAARIRCVLLGRVSSGRLKLFYGFPRALFATSEFHSLVGDSRDILTEFLAEELAN